MRKEFFANIDGDSIHFLSIDVNSDGTSIDPLQNDKCYALSNSPTLLNITHLNYFPARKSVWNGSSFVHPDGIEHKPACTAPCVEGCESIAFLVDNVYYGGIGYCIGVSNNDQRIAALSSSPEITFKTTKG